MLVEGGYGQLLLIRLGKAGAWAAHLLRLRRGCGISLGPMQVHCAQRMLPCALPCCRMQTLQELATREAAGDISLPDRYSMSMPYDLAACTAVLAQPPCLKIPSQSTHIVARAPPDHTQAPNAL